MFNSYKIDILWTHRTTTALPFVRYVLRMLACSNEDRGSQYTHQYPFNTQHFNLHVNQLHSCLPAFLRARPCASPFHSPSISPDNPGGISISTGVCQPDT